MDSASSQVHRPRCLDSSTWHSRRGQPPDSPAPHGLQDACAAALRREVQLFADVVPFLDELQHLPVAQRKGCHRLAQPHTAAPWRKGGRLPCRGQLQAPSRACSRQRLCQIRLPSPGVAVPWQGDRLPRKNRVPVS